MTDDLDPVWSSCEWDVLRDAYVARFGTLVDARPLYRRPEVLPDPLRIGEGDDPEEMGYLLTFAPHGPSAPERVYATFGAARTGGVELFVRSVVPSGFGGRLDEMIGVCPGEVAPLDHDEMTHAVLLPVDLGAFSFSLPAPQGASAERSVLQMVPLTEREARGAAEDFHRLVQRLHARGALAVADGYRPCALRKAPGHFWTPERLDQRRHAERRLGYSVERLERLLELNAPTSVVANEKSLALEIELELAWLRAHEEDALEKDLVRHRQADKVLALRREAHRRPLFPMTPREMTEVDSMSTLVLLSHPKLAPIVTEETGFEPVTLAQHPDRFPATLAGFLSTGERVELPREGLEQLIRGILEDMRRASVALDAATTWTILCESIMVPARDAAATDEVRAMREEAFRFIKTELFADAADARPGRAKLVDALVGLEAAMLRPLRHRPHYDDPPVEPDEVLD